MPYSIVLCILISCSQTTVKPLDFFAPLRLLKTDLPSWSRWFPEPRPYSWAVSRDILRPACPVRRVQKGGIAATIIGRTG